MRESTKSVATDDDSVKHAMTRMNKFEGCFIIFDV